MTKDVDTNMNLEGKPVKDLNSILEDLTLYCSLSGEVNPRIKLTLPKIVLDNYSNQFRPIERVHPEQNDNPFVVRYHSSHRIIVQLESFEDCDSENN